MDALLVTVLGAALAATPTAVPVDGPSAVVAETDTMNARQYDERTRLSRTHPNELWRLYGSDAAARGQWEDAIRHFRRAARYGDKYSQHRISLMYWHGVGVERDPALAYAWADLAAERMYPSFLVLREKMWEQLDQPTRDRALREGHGLYAEYGDAVAKPRFVRAIEQASRQITGSRTGYVGWMQVIGPTLGDGIFGGPGTFDLMPMYAQWRWDGDKFWAVGDAICTHGNVEVGPVSNGR